MKNVLLPAFLSIAVSSLSFAQTTTFGIKAGVNLPSVSSGFSLATNGKECFALFHGGVLVDIGVSNHFSIQTQLLYTGKGLKCHESDHAHTLTLTSIDVPVYTTYKITSGFFIGVGPNFGYYVTGKATSTLPGDEPHAYKFERSPFDFLNGWI